MLAILRNPAILAALAALVGAIGGEFTPDLLVTHTLEAISAIIAILGIIFGVATTHRIRVEPHVDPLHKT